MANKAIDKHYLLESLKDFYTTILLTFFQKKLTVNTVPDDPENGDPRRRNDAGGGNGRFRPDHLPGRGGCGRRGGDRAGESDKGRI